MHFALVDRVLESSETGAVTIKQVTLAEEYLQDHFPGFPVLPGVLMLEAMVQAARVVGERRGAPGPLVLREVRALKYNRFITPGSTMRAAVTLEGTGDDGRLSFRGEVSAVEPETGAEAMLTASGRFSLGPVRLGGA